ncbi:MAG: DUF3006 domain-containing protein [Eubacterium sp.]|nr:DUF3006 domain-containing protein [Eubacterium sp.]
MKWIVDRIEEGFAVVEAENEKMYNIPLDALEKGVKEGDVINVSVDKSETKKREEYIEKLMDDLFV